MIIKTCAVSYLNTKPLLYGLLRSPVQEQIELQLAIPSRCADLLLRGETQLGLIPVAVLPELPGAQVVSNYCIGTDGAVDTVALYADRPIEELDRIWLDHHSRTSVALTRILLRDYWQLQPELLQAHEGYIDQIGDHTGGLVIGDRTIGLEQRFAYKYDLGTAWKTWTGLPFVFATWVSTVPLPEAFLADFDAAQASGVAAIPELMYLLPHPEQYDLETYFTHHISYKLDEEKRRALDLFLRLLQEVPELV